MTCFDLVLRTRASLHPDGFPSDFISEHRGCIRATGDDGVLRPVGRLYAYRIHADLACRSGEPLAGVCDGHSRELQALHALLYEPGHYTFKGGLVDRFDAFDSDCLVLDYVVLHPRWRGLRLGLLAVRQAVDLLGAGCGLAVAHVAPLAPRACAELKVPRSWLPREEAAGAVPKLRGYFGRLGFERIGRTFYCGLSVARQAPTLSDLLRAPP